jgi:dTDP-4-amino-4,6-dideoxygalactose transaminase
MDQPVPILDLVAQYAGIANEVGPAVLRVLESGRYVDGEECRAFEQEFAAYCGAGYACGVANGSDALTVCLRAYGVAPGDDVVTVANTFIATAEAILLNGARPVFVDVDPETGMMDAGRLTGAITPRTRLILPVHLYGQPADIDAIRDVADRHGLPVLEDAAQGHGAVLNGRRVGGLGHAACFSFYPSKNLGACGDAGMVTSNDRAFIERVRRIANHGAGAQRYEHTVLGTNSRLDALQAAILRIKLRHLDEWIAARSAHALAYGAGLSGISALRLPSERPGTRSSWYLYTLRAQQRDALQAWLAECGIATAVHYPQPLHKQRALANVLTPAPSLPVSERLSGQVLSIPLYPELPDEGRERVILSIREFYGSQPAGQGSRERLAEHA